jgi:hypothetical protein
VLWRLQSAAEIEGTAHCWQIGGVGRQLVHGSLGALAGFSIRTGLATDTSRPAGGNMETEPNAQAWREMFDGPAP